MCTSIECIVKNAHRVAWVMGRRLFVEEVLPTFKQENPQIHFRTQMRRSHHPFLRAVYSEYSCAPHCASL